MSIWKTITRVSTAVVTAFFLFGCNEKQAMVEPISIDQPVEQHVINVNPEPKASQSAQDEWDRQMAANKAALDAIPFEEFSDEIVEIEPPEGRYELLEPTEPQKLTHFNEILNKQYAPRQMQVSTSDYKVKPSRKYEGVYASESVILSVYKYENSEFEPVVWCKSDAEHSEKDLIAYNRAYSELGDRLFTDMIDTVVIARGGHEAVIKSCK